MRPRASSLSHAIEDADALEASLGAHAGRKIRIAVARRGYPQPWVELARQNAVNALRMREASEARLDEQYGELGRFLGLAAPIQRLECFDVSHTQGEACAGNRNVMDFIIDAVKAHATPQEVCDVFRKTFGEYRDPGIY